uniref:dickkopf-related protein 1-like n=1 Tax=Doryrhamphus excisus TaxID=161450 RepID=UPI0025AE2F01|nr:dickkopf-related protein 1-like [Doryrhamphus excisus]
MKMASTCPWLWRVLLCTCLGGVLALDSNAIRWSKGDAQSPALLRGCGNHAQRTSYHADGDPEDAVTPIKSKETSACVRSSDCQAGLCCARYLTGRRCQRVPAEGDVCLLRGSKLRRKLGRCDCGAGLACSAPSLREGVRVKGQGLCVPRRGPGRGKTRRTAETGC